MFPFMHPKTRLCSLSHTGSPPSPLSPLPPEDDLPLLSPHNGPHHLEADGSHLDLNHELSEDPESALTAQQLNVDGTPRRPMNAFMIFARRRRPQVSAENTTMKTGQISKILSKEWGGMPMVSASSLRLIWILFPSMKNTLSFKSAIFLFHHPFFALPPG